MASINDITVINTIKKPGSVAVFLRKTLSLLLAVSLNWAGAQAVLETQAYLSDAEISKVNELQFGKLDFYLSSPTSDFIPYEIRPPETAQRSVKILSEESVPFLYEASTRLVGEDPSVCASLGLHARLEGQDYFEGKLLDFKTGLIPYMPDSGQSATSTDDWDFEIASLEPVQNQGSIAQCLFKLVFSGRQEGSCQEGSLYSDNEEMENTISIVSCAPYVEVLYPNGGEYWYAVQEGCENIDWCQNWCILKGMDKQCRYPIKWKAIDSGGQSHLLKIDIYYSNDSGQNWLPKIASQEKNDGIFWWRIPFQNAYASDKARIRVVAKKTGEEDYRCIGWDISDADFCPPLLTLEDVINQASSENLLPFRSDGGNTVAVPEALGTKAAAGQTTEDQPVRVMTIEEINRDLMAIQNGTTTQETLPQDDVPLSSESTNETLPGEDGLPQNPINEEPATIPPNQTANISEPDAESLPGL